MRPRKHRRVLLLAALALPALGWAALAAGGAQIFRQPIEHHASAALGRAVTIDGGIRLLVTPFSLHLSVDDVRIANAEWAESEDLLRAGTVSARLATFDLLIGRYAPRSLGLQHGKLHLERRFTDGAANWEIGAERKLFDPALVQRIDADDLLLQYDDPRRETEAWLKVVGVGPGAVRLSGNGNVGDRSYRLNGSAQSAEGQPFQFAMDAAGPDIALRLEGEGEGPFKLPKAKLNGGARGHDLAALASLAGLELPASSDFKLTAELRRGRGGWHFSRIAGHVGQTDLAGKLTLDQRGERPRIVAELSSKSFDLAEGMRLLGLRAESGSEAGLHYGGSPSTARLLPDATLSREALGRFDAVINYTAETVSGAPLAASHLTMRLALVDGRMMVSPASIDLGGGFLSSDIFIDARRSPALARYDIRLSPTPMGNVLAGWGVSPQETTALARGRIQLSGRGNTLRETIGNAEGRIALLMPAGRVRMQRASSSELDMEHLRSAMFGRGGNALGEMTSLNCGLIAFSVRDGIATSDPLLIDTDGHVLTGRGEIDLRSERIDMRLEADGKESAWFARPAPLIIGGTLTDPMVVREPVEYFTPQRFFGFSMRMPDLGAIFGFVDPERAQAPACGPLLRGAGMADRSDAADTPSQG